MRSTKKLPARGVRSEPKWYKNRIGPNPPIGSELAPAEAVRCNSAGHQDLFEMVGWKLVHSDQQILSTSCYIVWSTSLPIFHHLGVNCFWGFRRPWRCPNPDQIFDEISYRNADFSERWSREKHWILPLKRFGRQLHSLLYCIFIPQFVSWISDCLFCGNVSVPTYCHFAFLRSWLQS